jgi:hypothetical protein
MKGDEIRKLVSLMEKEGYEVVGIQDATNIGSVRRTIMLNIACGPDPIELLGHAIEGSINASEQSRS